MLCAMLHSVFGFIILSCFAVIYYIVAYHSVYAGFLCFVLLELSWSTVEVVTHLSHGHAFQWTRASDRCVLLESPAGGWMAHETELHSLCLQFPWKASWRKTASGTWQHENEGKRLFSYNLSDSLITKPGFFKYQEWYNISLKCDVAVSVIDYFS